MLEPDEFHMILRKKIAEAFWEDTPEGIAPGTNLGPVFDRIAFAVSGTLVGELGLKRERRTLPDGSGGLLTNPKTGVTKSFMRPPTPQSRWVTKWTTDDTHVAMYGDR